MKKELNKKELENVNGGTIFFLEIMDIIVSYQKASLADKEKMAEKIKGLIAFAKEKGLYNEFVKSDLYRDLKKIFPFIEDK